MPIDDGLGVAAVRRRAVVSGLALPLQYLYVRPPSLQLSRVNEHGCRSKLMAAQRAEVDVCECQNSWAFMSVFQILTSENFDEVLHNAQQVGAHKPYWQARTQLRNHVHLATRRSTQPHAHMYARTHARTNAWPAARLPRQRAHAHVYTHCGAGWLGRSRAMVSWTAMLVIMGCCCGIHPSICPSID